MEHGQGASSGAGTVLDLAVLDIARTLEARLAARRDVICGLPHRPKTDEQRRYERNGTYPRTLPVMGRAVPFLVPRILWAGGGGEYSPPEFARWIEETKHADPTVGRILSGTAMRDTDPLEASLTVGKAAGSASGRSRKFIEASAAEFERINARDVSELPLVGLMIDGLHIADHKAITALGVTPDGRQHVIGVHVAEKEDKREVVKLLRELVRRGLPIDGRFVVTVDGGRGIRAAVRKILPLCPVQRCRVHKARNIREQLPAAIVDDIIRRIWLAWSIPHYGTALATLEKIAAELDAIRPAAARSLREGLAETLTLQRIGTPRGIRQSLGNTNALERAFKPVRKLCKRITRWGSVDMIARWTAAGLAKAERAFMPLSGAANLLDLAAILTERSRALIAPEWCTVATPARRARRVIARSARRCPCTVRPAHRSTRPRADRRSAPARAP